MRNILGNIEFSFFKSTFLGKIFLGWCRLRVSKTDANVKSIEKILGWLGLAKVQMIALPKIKMRTADLQRVFENHVFGLKLWLGVVGHACILALWRQRRGLENLRSAWRPQN